jgi:glycogen phosphorylase
VPAAQSRRTHRPALTPADLQSRLGALAGNLWWTWNNAAKRLFEALDPALWRATGHNPLVVLRTLSAHRWAELAQDSAYAVALADCEAELKRYLKTKTWFERTATRGQKQMRIAYFCAEYALHESMQLYAGGLGVLAGDHLKSASDLGIPLTGVGLIYRHGYYRQHLSGGGKTRVVYPTYDYADWPVEDTGLVIDVPMMRRTVRAKIWKLLVGRVELYLLDTDIEGNRKSDREITKFLYGGDHEYRVQQEIILGIGGRLALLALGIEPTVYHLNEGHAAFCTLARLQRLTGLGAGLEETIDFVRETTVFTTHTPVPAGNDRFAPALTWKYLQPIAAALGLSKQELLAFGRENPSDKNEDFCMTVLALRLADHCNGVAELHGDTSRQMWQRVFGASDSREVPISHVTNGIHVQTWLAPEAEAVYDRYLKPDWHGAYPDDDYWARLNRVPDEVLWEMRQQLRAKLVQFVRARMHDQVARRVGPLEEHLAALETFSDEALTIGFARRFATYKRAPLIFRDAKRLAALMGDAERPVQLVFAGKAHPFDAEGKGFIERICKLAGSDAFRGRVVLLEDYDMHIGRMLTAGCDVWLNNPIRPLEASGTSGMKPPLHGGINCSILDGWWPESYDGRNGWAIGNGETFRAQARQDKYDAERIYELLEGEIVPTFYQRGRGGLPKRWLRMMRRSMMTIPAAFSSHRMLADYLDGYYLPAHLGE